MHSPIVTHEEFRDIHVHVLVSPYLVPNLWTMYIVRNVYNKLLDYLDLNLKSYKYIDSF